MACPLTISKFVGTVSLGLLTGVSYATSTITIPSLKLLPSAGTASRSLNEVKRLSRKHAMRLSGVANGLLLFAYTLSPPRRKHPFLIWMVVFSSSSALATDYWFNRSLGFQEWALETIRDTIGLSLGRASGRKDEDLVVVEAEEDINGEAVRLDMDREGRLQYVRSLIAGVAFSIGVVGLWGDRR
ncbi:hypothetical protein N7468_002658 [Penicillium chermesinum]|uniref:Uncharacterized protein n=1 Tax=Penicillium chermesinum TaxID=63820 RepID=A0A9W9TXU7_9EURO|nr:uncharacterized protein N7468_002658 [Penicillium chermesinum]KAJ5247675.1 hypothetical protein N7468_002658 [Penicillium chermesinum]KAJ6151439.1 hypothetical protein N7470_007036 [Penicillium chermesinum]